MPFDTLPAWPGFTDHYPLNDLYTVNYGQAVTPFPAGPLDVRVEILLNGVWTDITPFCDDGGLAQIVRGHPDESTTTPPTTLNLGIFNGDGRFTPGNPS